ncbi:MAG TPA: VCBS repeat-containing protein, partial [Candidatus Kapabacteria bacterium]|nr:VCBS repeat-containing protein [Candidatus Kapabacteria bacterium]
RPFCLIDDIDNDGNYEIVFADSDADLMIYEYKNGEFTFEFSIIHEGEGGTEFLQSGDINGDGKKELVFGYYSYQGPSLQGEFDPSLWHYSIIHSTSPNVYEKLNTQYFYGVRIGSEFERGVRVANIDGKKGDELIISIFPKTYIMRWDDAVSDLQPFWYCDTTFSRTAIILDRENSEKKLVGITTFNSVTFFETQDEKQPGPDIVIAKPINETTPLLRWKNFPNADSYTIDVYIYPYSQNTSPQYSYTVQSTEFSQEQFPTNTPYIFTITAKSGNTVLSLPSISPVVYLHSQSDLLSAEAQSNEVILLKYGGFLPQTPISPFLFSLSDTKNTNSIVRPITALIADDSTIILRFSSPISFTEAIVKSLPFYDRFSLLTIEGEKTITIPQNRQFDSLFLSSITVVNPTTLNLLFSKKIDEVSVKEINNYTIDPERFISSVHIDNESSVTLFLDNSAPLIPIGKNYILTAKNLRDISGQPMTRGAGSVIGFSLAADNGEQAFMYPSPVRLSDKQPVFFGNLPPRATITIMTLDGVRLLTLEETDGNGGIEWNGLTENNEELSTGVYLFKVEGYDKSGNSVAPILKKFSVKK